MKLVRLAFVMAAASMPLVAHADAKKEAQAHIDRAMQLHEQGKFKQALDELMFAYSLDPKPELLYAIGQVHVKLGNCSQAITFYERFLTSKPDAGPAAAAREAIETCKTNPPEPPKEPEPEPKPEPKPEPPPEPPKPVITTTTQPFYTDVLGDALLGGGVVAGAVSIFMYTRARADLDSADAAATYDEQLDLVDKAKSKRTLSVVFGVAGAGLAIGGIVRYVTGDRTVTVESRGVAIVPATDGGLISYRGRF